MKGRKPRPTPLKVLSGDRAGRVNESEPKPRAGRPSPPERFDAAARERWGRLCDELEAMGVLSTAHAFALEVYCTAYSRALIAEAALQKHGAILVSGEGADVVMKSNPAAAMAAACEAMMTRVLTEFGLTAASVSKVKSRDDAPKDKFSEFLAKRKAK